MAKVKPKPKLPTFEVTEYSFGELDNRQQYGDVDLKLQFEDDFDMNFSISFHEFLDHHKRKKSDLWRHVERIQAKLTGWGTRYFDLLEALSRVGFRPA